MALFGINNLDNSLKARAFACGKSVFLTFNDHVECAQCIQCNMKYHDDDMKYCRKLKESNKKVWGLLTIVLPYNDFTVLCYEL
jgi:hypothetical protein